MSDNNTNPGEHPAIPPVPPAPPQYPGAAPQPAYSPPQSSPQHSAPPQYSPPPQYAAPQQPSAAPQHYAPAQQYSPPPQYAAPQQPGSAPYAPARPTSGLAVTSLVTGIASIVFSWTFIALLASIVAVITGHMAIGRTRSNASVGGRGMAIAGLIIGYVGVAILAVMLAITIFSFLFIGAGFIPFLYS
jgi:hypothetical protein